MQVFEYMRQVRLLEESAEEGTSCSKIESLHAFAFRGVTELQRKSDFHVAIPSSYFTIIVSRTLGTRLLGSSTPTARLTRDLFH